MCWLLSATGSPIPFPIGPAARLPSVNGTAYPPYRVIFEHGECTVDDPTSSINQNKTCFSCFRIPTLLGGSTPGVIHAFACRLPVWCSLFHLVGMFSCAPCIFSTPPSSESARADQRIQSSRKTRKMRKMRKMRARRKNDSPNFPSNDSPVFFPPLSENAISIK